MSHTLRQCICIKIILKRLYDDVEAIYELYCHRQNNVLKIHNC